MVVSVSRTELLRRRRHRASAATRNRRRCAVRGVAGPDNTRDVPSRPGTDRPTSRSRSSRPTTPRWRCVSSSGRRSSPVSPRSWRRSGEFPSPAGANAAHLVGYLSPVSEEELAAQRAQGGTARIGAAIWWGGPGWNGSTTMRCAAPEESYGRGRPPRQGERDRRRAARHARQPPRDQHRRGRPSGRRATAQRGHRPGSHPQRPGRVAVRRSERRGRRSGPPHRTDRGARQLPDLRPGDLGGRHLVGRLRRHHQ